MGITKYQKNTSEYFFACRGHVLDVPLSRRVLNIKFESNYFDFIQIILSKLFKKCFLLVLKRKSC